jgi:hypothetical protein
MPTDCVTCWMRLVRRLSLEQGWPYPYIRWNAFKISLVE